MKVNASNNTTVTASSLSTAIVTIGLAIFHTWKPNITITPEVTGALILVATSVVTMLIKHPYDKIKASISDAKEEKTDVQ